MENNVSAILEGLNPAQQDAVKATEGPVLIVAGAGSGKTRVLTSRVAYLLAGGVEPSRILALTFTKKAAGEMKERIALMVGEKRARKVVMGTFHSVFVRFLRKYAEFLGYPQQFTIYDTSDSTSAIKVCLKELKLDQDKNYKPKDVLARISNAKNNLVTWESYNSRPELVQADRRAQRARLGELYKLYQQKLKASGVMDFDDILVNMNILLRDNPEALKDLASSFYYIMVDEYQDTNFAQYIILRKLASQYHNICVVGDDSQSIYAFRGAKIENILNFKKDYPDCKIVRLERNYRSTRTIVEAANSVIAHNEGRIPKECYSEGERGEKIRVLDCMTDAEESALVVQEIVNRMRTDHAEYRDFAILYRTNAQSRSLEECLRRRNIPYMIYSGNSFFERAEVKDLMAYFKLSVNPYDDESFKRAVNKPARGIGDTTISALETFARQKGISLFQAVYSEDLVAVLREAATKKLREFCAMIDKFAVAAQREEAAALAKRIADESGIYPFYKADTSVEGMSRTANVEELISSVAAYVDELVEEAENNGDEVPVVTLGEYLENVSLLSNVDVAEDEDDSNRVALMTVHSAKGLEFPYVMIVGLEENLFPSSNMVFSAQDLEEERRLFYVALTRAKKDVVLAYAHDRFRNGRHESNSVSRFVREIDPKYLANPIKPEFDILTGRSKPSFGGFGSRFGSPYGASSRPVTVPKKPTPTPVATPVRTPQPSKPAVQYADFEPVHMTELYEGERIEHNRFGPGKIISITGVVPELKAEVEFDHYGRKTLLLKYAKMRPEQK
ncbi:MAG: UvrD-helicase domain-containing protein [Bacteroidales bacterium]|nr:UvrD-helicase domain-containing protein [Bacteroidales bacterium]